MALAAAVHAATISQVLPLTTSTEAAAEADKDAAARRVGGESRKDDFRDAELPRFTSATQCLSASLRVFRFAFGR